MKLIKADSFYFSNSYISGYICYDYSAGKQNRYYLLINTEENPFVAGRELPLKDCKEIIKYLFKASKEFTYLNRSNVEKVFKRVQKLRLKEVYGLE